jgi:hypothetical protein
MLIGIMLQLLQTEGAVGADMPVTVRKTDNELPADLRHDADSGPVILPSYTVLNREDWKRLLGRIDEAADEREFKIARDRRTGGEAEGATLDEMREKYGL